MSLGIRDNMLSRVGHIGASEIGSNALVDHYPSALPLYTDADDFRRATLAFMRVDADLKVATLNGEPQEGRDVSYRFDSDTLKAVDALYQEIAERIKEGSIICLDAMGEQ